MIYVTKSQLQESINCLQTFRTTAVNLNESASLPTTIIFTIQDKYNPNTDVYGQEIQYNFYTDVKPNLSTNENYVTIDIFTLLDKDENTIDLLDIPSGQYYYTLGIQLGNFLYTVDNGILTLFDNLNRSIQLDTPAVDQESTTPLRDIYK